jgi:hypothetical protein
MISLAVSIKMRRNLNRRNKNFKTCKSFTLHNIDTKVTTTLATMQNRNKQLLPLNLNGALEVLYYLKQHLILLHKTYAPGEDVICQREDVIDATTDHGRHFQFPHTVFPQKQNHICY